MQVSSTDLEALAEQLRRHFDQRGLTQAALSDATGVHQSQISRILSGRIQRVSVNVLKLCKYANFPSPADVGGAAAIAMHAALDDLWDGSADGAQKITQLLRAAASLQQEPRSRHKGR
jgi:transcriptional regulator with XRE-family HTH domain